MLSVILEVFTFLDKIELNLTHYDLVVERIPHSQRHRCMVATNQRLILMTFILKSEKHGSLKEQLYQVRGIEIVVEASGEVNSVSCLHTGYDESLALVAITS